MSTEPTKEVPETEFVVRWIDGCGEGLLYMKNVLDIRSWAKANARVLGKPQLHVATYEVRLRNGDVPSPEVLKKIQPEDSEDLYRKWYIENTKFLTGGPICEDSIPALYSGAAQAAIFKSGHLSEKEK